ncbi:MAG: biopolymer transporter ExbD [Sphingobium sp.]|nr:biopolymer transporter ExbD [Sphingobium sp.]
MAFATSTDDRRPMSDLNTTPLIDVMLVLLIMFILTIPQQSHKVGIDLPTAPPPTPIAPDLVRNRITIDAAGGLAWNGNRVDRAGLRGLLKASMHMPVEPALDFVPAAEARYELVDGVIADIKRAGVTKLGLPGNQAYSAF